MKLRSPSHEASLGNIYAAISLVSPPPRHLPRLERPRRVPARPSNASPPFVNLAFSHFTSVSFTRCFTWIFFIDAHFLFLLVLSSLLSSNSTSVSFWTSCFFTRMFFGGSLYTFSSFFSCLFYSLSCPAYVSLSAFSHSLSSLPSSLCLSLF